MLVGVAGCGSDTAAAGSGGGSSGSGAQKVTIKEPTEGASITIPFMLRLDSNVELGPTDSGKHHVHLYFDGNDSKYEVIESENVQITDKSPAVAGLKAGQHKMNISLRNADHSAAGFDTSITVRTGGGGGGAQPTDDGGTGGGGY
ncbi:hypothetical protein [Actinophytocola sp.]|uniref:hypothetical protein n=1 Tax=Actinophytocola sp. TaxID=1872138 RepID=UPI003899FBC2